MLYLITYDISEDKRRKKLSDFLEGYGTRVQKSVFECSVNEKLLKQIIYRISKIVKSDDSVRIYPLCNSCFAKAVGIGNKIAIPGSKGYEVF